MSGAVTFHLPAAVLDGHEVLKPFYSKLIDGFRATGLTVGLRPHRRASLPEVVQATPGFHIVDHGTLRHPRVLNAGVAYIYPFWHFDPHGIRARSSITSMRFDPKVDDPEAGPFTRRLRRRLVDARISRYPQSEARESLPPGAVAVFLQSEGHRAVDETCHLTQGQMLRALVARDDPSPILIKPHPRDTDPATARRLAKLGRTDRRVIVTQANIHDMLSAARVVVTINSAVGLEAMLHRKPVVLCGEADFHHCAVTVRGRADLDGGIAEAVGTVWPHDRFLHWYLGIQCLNAGRPSLVADALARIATMGFDLGPAADEIRLRSGR